MLLRTALGRREAGLLVSGDGVGIVNFGDPCSEAFVGIVICTSLLASSSMFSTSTTGVGAALGVSISFLAASISSCRNLTFCASFSR